MDTLDTLPPSPAPKKDGGIGPILGIIIIVILIALGGLYYFTTGINNLEQQEIQDETTPDEAAATLEVQGTSDDLADIEADLNASDFSNLDESVTSFDAEFETQ